jgi:hypothetical protein
MYKACTLHMMGTQSDQAVCSKNYLPEKETHEFAAYSINYVPLKTVSQAHYSTSPLVCLLLLTSTYTVLTITS